MGLLDHIKQKARAYPDTNLFQWKAGVIFAVIMGASYGIYSCGQRDVIQVGGPGETGTATTTQANACGTNPAGATRTQACPDGESGTVYEVCQASGAWEEVSRSCAEAEGSTCNSVTFADNVKPLMDQKCIGCHGQWASADAEAIKKDFTAIKYRVTTPNGGEVMPPNNRLPPGDVNTFLGWEEGGFIESKSDCESKGAAIQLRDINAAMIALASADIEERTFKAGHPLGREVANIRFAIMAHKVNEGIVGEEFRKQLAGLNKSLNSVSLVDDIVTCAAVGPEQSVCGISLDDFGWTKDDWDAFVAGDDLKIVDNTTSGKILQDLTGARQPWLHADNLAILNQEADAYYNVRGIPATLQQYLKDKGVDLIQQINDREVVIAGTTKSPISLQKHRAVMFFEQGNRDHCSITFDPNRADENLQENPLIDPFLPGNLNGQRQFFFDFVASETICLLENGMIEFALWAAGGARQNAAPLNVVVDNEGQFAPTPEIQPGTSCQFCHGNEAATSGFKEVSDEVGQFYKESNGNLDANTLDLVRDIYNQKTKLAGILSQTNKAHAKALALVGQNPGDGNVYKAITYPFKANWGLEKMAALLFISPDELKVGINSSNLLRAQIGGLLTGATITEGQAKAAIPVVIREMRLFQD